MGVSRNQDSEVSHWRPDCPRAACRLRILEPSHDQLREAVGAANELAVGVGRQQRHVADIAVGQLDAEHIRGLGLELAPGRHAAIGAFDQLTGCDRIAGSLKTYSRRKTWCEGCEV